ncbi:MAG: RDD family protein [Rhodobiaceae bacterium]|nr:RDD family protein [Rhodobiaceae bacterium]MCC0056440.1 RDD family protein [Rhodobiaceae bacterium]
MSEWQQPADRSDVYEGQSMGYLFESVLSRRTLAFLIDAAIIIAIMIALSVIFFALGIMTFGLAMPLLALVYPISGLGYTALTLGGRNSATVGMRMMGLEMRTTYGAPMYPLLAVAHALVFYFSFAFLTPFVLIVALFNRRKRLLHDLICGTIVINRPD